LYSAEMQQLEIQIFGSIFLDSTLTKEVLAAVPIDAIRGDVRHRNLYRMMRQLDEKGIEVNLTTITTYFQKNLENIGGLVYLTEMAGSVASTSTLQFHIQQLLEFNARIQAIGLFNEFKQRFEDPLSGNFEEILDEFEQKSLEIRPKIQRQDQTIQNITGWYENLVLKSNDPALALGLMTGWKDIDRMTLGFQRSDLIVVGARTSMGKSAFAIETALRVSQRGYKVAIFSLEMNIEQIYNRMIGNLAHITLQQLRMGNLHNGQLEKIAEHMNTISKIHLDDSRAVTAEYICSEMRRLKRHEGIDLVIIDYLQEIKEPFERSDNTGSALHRVCQKIRAAAQACDCSVIGLSQVKREVEQRANKRPMTSDLSGSAAIEAVADVIIMLYRDEYYNPGTDERGILEVNVAKQRNGPVGVAKLNYDKDYQKITGKGGDSHAEQVVGV
jgi:replicative DNA helicase